MTGIAMGLALVASILSGGAIAAETPCRPAFEHGRAEVALPLHPLSVVQLNHSCVALVALSDDGDPAKGGIAILPLGGDKLRVSSTFDLATQPVGMSVTRDESIVAVAGISRIYFLSVQALLAGKSNALLGTAEYDKSAGTVSVATTPDEHLLFASDEDARTVTVLDFAAARKSGFTKVPVLGRVPVDNAPTVLVMARDGEHVFLPVERVLRALHPPITCASEGNPGGPPVNASGAILVIGVAAALAAPQNAVLSRTYAGCFPVRMALSLNGRTAWVTNRLGDAVRTMDVEKILDGNKAAQIGIASTGPTPIGVAPVDDDRLVLVSNSDRWAHDRAPETLSLFAVSPARSRLTTLGTIRVGSFPRDIAVAPDGRTVFVSNFGSNSLTLLDVKKLRQMARPTTPPSR